LWNASHDTLEYKTRNLRELTDEQISQTVASMTTADRFKERFVGRATAGDQGARLVASARFRQIVNGASDEPVRGGRQAQDAGLPR
jgi:hypothetical protein